MSALPTTELRRLAATWTPDCWLGCIARAIAPCSHDVGGSLVRTPTHFLVAAWPPCTQPMSRFPEWVAIASPDADRALCELLRRVPAREPVHLLDAERVDTALLAEIVLVADRHLEPYQRSALEDYVQRERLRVREALAAVYTDRDAGFDRFRSRLLGDS